MNKSYVNKWLINFYEGQIIKVNKKIINLLDQKSEFIKLENELINRVDFINFLLDDIKKVEQTIKELTNELKI